MWKYNYSDELYHHGVLGMKWGIRRYQNKDGSLTPAGKRKAAKMKAKYTELTGKQLRSSPSKTKSQNGKASSEVPKKSIKDLSDDELRSRINRLRAEKDYMDLSKQISAMNPKQISAGKKFVSHVGNKIIVPALTDAGKRIFTDFVTKQASNALGLNKGEVKDSLESLRKEVAGLNLKKQKIELDDYFDKRKKSR